MNTRLTTELLNARAKQLLWEDEQRRIDEWAGRINDNRREYASMFDPYSFFLASRKLLVQAVTCGGDVGVWWALALMFTQRACLLEVARKMRTQEILMFGGGGL